MAQPAWGVVRGLGSQGAASAGVGVGVVAPAGAERSAAARLRPAGGRVGPGTDGVLWQFVGIGRGASGVGGHGVVAASLRAVAGVGASAGSVACAWLPSGVSAGVGVGSCGGVELRVGAVAVGSSRRAPGLGRAHARFSHRAGGLERPFSGAAFGSGSALGVARVGACDGAFGDGLGIAARGASGAVETCVESSRPATSYRAAGWSYVGRTSGRPPGSAVAAEPKGVWLRGLSAGWEACLRRSPARLPGSFPALGLSDEARWSRCEFARSDLVDGRLRRRLERLGAAWERHPGAPLPAVFPGSAEQQAAYRFLHNKQVAADDILQPHREALVERCRSASAVLLVQDTTTLNYTGLKDSTRGLGPLQERTSSARGLFVHAAVAFTEGRRALGVSGLETWARPEAEPAAEREKESRRWPGLRSGPGVGTGLPADAGGGGRGPRERHLRAAEVAGRARGRGRSSGAGQREPAAAGAGLGPAVAGDDAPDAGIAAGLEDGAGSVDRCAGRDGRVGGGRR